MKQRNFVLLFLGLAFWTVSLQLSSAAVTSIERWCDVQAFLSRSSLGDLGDPRRTYEEWFTMGKAHLGITTISWYEELNYSAEAGMQFTSTFRPYVNDEWDFTTNGKTNAASRNPLGGFFTTRYRTVHGLARIHHGVRFEVGRNSVFRINKFNFQPINNGDDGISNNSYIQLQVQRLGSGYAFPPIRTSGTGRLFGKNVSHNLIPGTYIMIFTSRSDEICSTFDSRTNANVELKHDLDVSIRLRVK